MGFMNFLVYLNMSFITFLLVEFFLTIIFTQKWKFRFKRAKGYPNLRPHSKGWKLTWTFLVVTIVLLPILISLIYLYLPELLIGIGFLQFSVLFFTSPIAYLWIKLRIINKKGFSRWDVIPILISIISLTTFLITIFN
jgi:hypothetical protein